MSVLHWKENCSWNDGWKSWELTISSISVIKHSLPIIYLFILLEIKLPHMGDMSGICSKQSCEIF